MNRIAEDLDEATKEAILVREPQCDQSWRVAFTLFR